VTTLPELSEEKAIEAIRHFFRGKPFVFFGSGMSCAMDTRFGMPALKDVLLDEISRHKLSELEQMEWNSVVSNLTDGIDLENSLNSVSDQNLIRMITEITGSFIANLDKEFCYSISSGKNKWPASVLIKRLVDNLPEGDPILHVLTPNYDMLFEYACDYENITYTNGLFGGIIRKKNWSAVNRALLEPERIVKSGKLKTIYRHKKHIRLYKVHGSLNYFFHRNTFIENNAWMWEPPEFIERVMITPGLSKYQTLQRYRQELLQSADSAIEKATHFLFLGYGFNDNHLEEYIRRKLIAQSSHGLIVTMNSNERIESLLRESENLWIVCQANDNSNNSTRIYNKKHLKPLIIKGKSLWEIEKFLIRIFGG